MILQQQHNTAVAAPQLLDVNSALIAFRSWKGFAWLTVNDLFVFMAQPSPERTTFLESLQQTITVVRTDYVTKNYN